MSSFGVVLDANVLFSAPLRDTLLRAADAGLFRLHWTDEILEEVRRNLIETGRSTKQKAERLVTTMQTYFPEANVTGYEPLVPAMTNDPKDRHVLAAAVISRCQVIVTHNLRDFPEVALSTFNIEAQSPDRFLTYVFDLAPDVMTQIITDQAADLHTRPQTVDRVLSSLARHAPEFANLVREHLSIVSEESHEPPSEPKQR
jgi:predicted nucleic acid-binding protein